jgi:hypothetical protein
MKLCQHLLGACLAAGVVLPAGQALAADVTPDSHGFVIVKLGEEVWTEYPGIPGIQRMVLGPYVIRVRFAKGTMSMPHHHPEDRLVTVIKGTWFSGTGETFEPWDTVPLPAGSFMKHPAGEGHYDGAKDDEVIVQIAGNGPSGTTFYQPDLGRTGNGLKRKD